MRFGFTARFSLTLVVAILVPVSASAADWEKTFEPEAVEARMEESEQRFVVIPAGSSEEADAAAAALAAALREGKAKLVMGDSNVGDVRSLDDEKIVEKASGLPVDRIAVVRTFPGGDDAPPRVVVTVYKPDGTNVVGITGRSGTRLEPESAESESPSEGVSREASETVSETAGEAAEDRKASREKFLKKFLWFREELYVNTSSGAVGRATVPYQGKYQKELQYDEFYRITGNDDLAAQYKRRKRTSAALRIGGFVGVLAGTTAVLLPILDSETTAGGPIFWTGVGVGGASVIVSFVGQNLEIHPVSPSERRRMADEYNEKLKDEVGLSTDYEPTKDDIESKSGALREPLRLNVGIGPSRTGAGVHLNVNF